MLLFLFSLRLGAPILFSPTLGAEGGKIKNLKGLRLS